MNSKEFFAVIICIYTIYIRIYMSHVAHMRMQLGACMHIHAVQYYIYLYSMHPYIIRTHACSRACVAAC
jgi:hypothetical protein